MDVNKIRIGIISEKQFVNTFATTKQKKKYYEDNAFTGSNKNTLLKDASRYCDIEDIGNKQYRISDIHKYPIPKSMSKMKNGLYQYMIPLILSKLVDGHDKNNKITLTSSKWARQIKMINSNYNAVKYHKTATSDYFQYEKNDINDFFDKADDAIVRQLEQSLKYLTDAGVIFWEKVFMVYKEKIDEKIVNVSEDHDIIISRTQDIHKMTDKEKSFYAECIKIADAESGAEDNQSRYFGEHARKYNEVLARELKKQNIAFVYQSYEVNYINLDKCKNLLGLFEDINNDDFIDKFNAEFQNMLMGNAETRYIKRLKDYSADYIHTFKNLSDMTINNKSESVWGRLNLSKNETDYKLHIQTTSGKLQ
jgi:hypothetical protein